MHFRENKRRNGDDVDSRKIKENGDDGDSMKIKVELMMVIQGK